MSVLIIGRFKGDTAKFRQALADRPDEFAKIAEEAKAPWSQPPLYQVPVRPWELSCAAVGAHVVSDVPGRLVQRRALGGQDAADLRGLPVAVPVEDRVQVVQV